jgi:hypothetical protein
MLGAAEADQPVSRAQIFSRGVRPSALVISR